jgi:hypothetical protein
VIDFRVNAKQTPEEAMAKYWLVRSYGLNSEIARRLRSWRQIVIDTYLAECLRNDKVMLERLGEKGYIEICKRYHVSVNKLILKES